MIIARTPLRVSFFGGGADYPVWHHEHGRKAPAPTPSSTSAAVLCNARWSGSRKNDKS